LVKPGDGVFMRDLQTTVREAMASLVNETGLDPDELFGDRVLELERLPGAAAHAAGLMEGAAIALGLTVLELLDELDGPLDSAGG
jgi:hypothetical protein